MLENFIMQVRRPKGVLGEREAFVSCAAKASAAACYNNRRVENTGVKYFGDP